MIRVPLQKYTVRKGDNLDQIARGHGYSSWRVIHDCEFNASFKRQRPNPDKIFPGDIVTLPPKARNVVSALRKSNNMLIEAKSKLIEGANQDIQEINNSFKKVKSWGDGVDAAASVIMILKDLGQLAYKGMKAIKLDGEQLKRMNEQLAKDVLGNSHEKVYDAGMQVYSKADMDNNIVTAATQIIIKSYFDMTSPSFWANTITNLMNGMNWSEAVTTKPEDVRDKVIRTFVNNRNKLTGNLDRRIEENKRLINKFSRLVEKPLPLKIEPKSSNYMLY